MTLLSYAYRFISNFLFLAMAYYSLNFLERYEQRTIVAALVLAYVLLRILSSLRSFYFFQRIERLEIESRRLIGSAVAARPLIGEVAGLRRASEMKSYIDLLFLSLVLLLCFSKIVSGS